MALVVPGEGTQSLARAVAHGLGASLARVEFKTFPDGEEYARILDAVDGQDVVVVQTTYPAARLMKLLLLLSAARENGARSVRAVVPYLAYARQDRVFQAGEALSARVAAHAISALADECLTIDLHKTDTTRWFDIPVQDLPADQPVADNLRKLGTDLVLAPDAGARPRAERIARILGVEVDHLEKVRISSTQVEMKTKSLDVRGKRVAVVDDIISTGGTMALAIERLLQNGAKAVYAVGVHGLFLADAVDRLKRAGTQEILATDTVPSPYSRISVAPVIVEALTSARVAAR